MLDFKVQIAKPVVQVLCPELLKPSELVKLLVHRSEDQRSLKLALVDAKLRVADGKAAPSYTVVLWNSGRFQQD